MTDPTDCPHGGGQSCVQCRHGVDDIVEAWVLDARANAANPLAADIAEALVRNAGGPHLDSTSPEEAATIAASQAVVRRARLDPVTRPWRTGRSRPETIYMMVGPEPSDADELLGVLMPTGAAHAAVEAHNRLAELPWQEEEIRALRDADRLHLLPPEALIASIKHLATLLVGPAEAPDLPAHLRDDAPVAVCGRCGRETVDVELCGQEDRMTQPDGFPCGGRFGDTVSAARE